jgi:hypothetical protein
MYDNAKCYGINLVWFEFSDYRTLRRYDSILPSTIVDMFVYVNPSQKARHDPHSMEAFPSLQLATSCHPDPLLANCSAKYKRFPVFEPYGHTYRHTGWWIRCPDPSLTPSLCLIAVQVTHVPRSTIAWLDRCAPIRWLAKQDMPHVFQNDSRLHAWEVPLS